MQCMVFNLAHTNRAKNIFCQYDLNFFFSGIGKGWNISSVLEVEFVNPS